MTFKQLLERSKINPKYAFFLGMIYGWPIVKDGFVEAYSEYGTGSRIKAKFSQGEFIKIQDMNLTGILKFIDGTDIKRADIKSNGTDSGWSCSILFKDIDGLDSDTEQGRAFIYGLIEKSLIDFSNESAKYFISGIFNARGSLDFNHLLIAVDLEKKIYPNLARRKYLTLSKLTGYFYNFNPRILQVKSSSKNDQFRIPLKVFVSEYGLMLPFKIAYYEREVGKTVKAIGDLYFDKYDLTGTGEYKNYNLALQINNLAIDFKSGIITEESLLRQRLELGLDNDDEDLDTILNANPNVKESRKRLHDYLCEVDNHHATFIAKINNSPFVEGHHLIPFCKRNHFAVNIDIVENIVALCPTCHRKIHLAIDTDRFNLLDKLYDENIDGLRSSGISITKPELYSFYR